MSPFKKDTPFIIAEVGKNFIQTEEDRPVAEYLENAKSLAKAAKDAGADAVKYQTHVVEDEQLPIEVVSPHFKGADRYRWVTRNMEATPVEEFWKPLKAYCDELDILFFSTPMSRKAAVRVNELEVPLFKVGSGDVQDYATLDYIVETGKPLIISSGMVSLSELKEIMSLLKGKKVETGLLYCVSQYPAPKEYFNLATIEHFKEEYPEATIGFSDHSLGDEVSRAAAAVGARIIEKHFTFDRALWGADHKSSMTPEEFGLMVGRIRANDLVDPASYLGEKTKELEGADNQFRPYFNKTLVAGADIKKGETFTRENLYAMRPKTAGVRGAEEYYDVLGTSAERDYKKYEPID